MNNVPTKVLLAILPHPDDESLGFGGTLAKYGHNPNVETYLITVTRGQAGNLGDPKLKATRKTLPQIREQELHCAAKILGIDHIQVLNYDDGELAAVQEEQGIADMVRFITKVKPQVVITFGPDGGYGHPDHVALSHWVTQTVTRTPKVKKLYYKAIKKDFSQTFLKQFGPIILNGEIMPIVTHGDDYITTTIDCRDFVDIKFRALHCHQTQLVNVRQFEKMRQLGVKTMITHDYYHLAIGRGKFKPKETDLFEGI